MNVIEECDFGPIHGLAELKAQANPRTARVGPLILLNPTRQFAFVSVGCCATNLLGASKSGSLAGNQQSIDFILRMPGP
jgi:hypothetical protein